MCVYVRSSALKKSVKRSGLTATWSKIAYFNGIFPVLTHGITAGKNKVAYNTVLMK